MALNVTIFFADNTILDAGTPMQLLSNGSALATAQMGDAGTVTFDVDPTSSQGLSVRVDTQDPPASNP